MVGGGGGGVIRLQPCKFTKMGDIGFDGEVFEKNQRIGGGGAPPCETLLIRDNLWESLLIRDIIRRDWIRKKNSS